jgi:hypothetical protein
VPLPDRVLVTEGGTRQEMSLDAFLKLPLHRRVAVILARAVEFYAGNVLIERQEALKLLRTIKTEG